MARDEDIILCGVVFFVLSENRNQSGVFAQVELGRQHFVAQIPHPTRHVDSPGLAERSQIGAPSGLSCSFLALDLLLVRNISSASSGKVRS